jgi:hypothetical protein
VAEPLLEFKERHGLLGVAEHTGDRRACPVARQLTASVSVRDARLVTVQGDQPGIEGCHADHAATIGEQVLHNRGGFGVQHGGLCRPHLLIWRLSKGKLAELWQEADRLRLMQQLAISI